MPVAVDPTAQTNLVNHNVLRRLDAANARCNVLLVHDQDSSADPAFQYEVVWYRTFAPLGGINGIGCGGLIDDTVTAGSPIRTFIVDTTNMLVGPPQFPLDRSRVPFDDSDYHAWYFDTSAAAPDGTTPGHAGSFVPTVGMEFMFDADDPVADGQNIYSLEVQAQGIPALDAWLDGEVDFTVGVAIPGEDPSGVNPIVGGPNLSFLTARGFGDPVASGVNLEGGLPYELAGVTVVVPPGDPGSGPKVIVQSKPTSEFQNRSTRFVSSFAFARAKTAAAGVALMPIALPRVEHFDLSLASPPARAVNSPVWKSLSTLCGGFGAIIFRTGGFVSAGFPSATPEADFLTTIKNTSNPATAPFGEYRADWVESLVDWVNDIEDKTGGGQGNTPVLIILSHHIYGATLAEMDLVRATLKKAVQWSLSNPAVTPYHVQRTQVWLYNVAFIDPWNGVSAATIMTGQGGNKFVRKNCTVFRGPWAQGTVYAVGDGVIRTETADLKIPDEGYWVVKAGGAHTSAANGVNGPPEDAAQTRWERMDLRLNDAGKIREVTKVNEQIAAARAESFKTTPANLAISLGIGL